MKENKFEEPAKRETGFSEIVGVNPEQKGKVSNFAKEVLDNQSRKTIFENSPEIGQFEREKTREETEMIKDILDKMPDFVRRYGGIPIFLEPKHIHILDESRLDEETRKKKLESEEGGGYLPDQQFAYIFDAGSNLINAQKIIHEILHFNSFQSLEKVPEESKSLRTRLRRVGFQIFSYNPKDKKDVYSPENIYFNEFNEAVIEELTKRFDKEYFDSIPGTAEGVKERQSFIDKYSPKEDNDISSVITKQLESGKWRTVIKQYEYSKERRKLNELTKDIYERNPDRFESTEDVFNVFAKATMGGKLSETARLIEKTYGKGSFRKWGEGTKYKKK